MKLSACTAPSPGNRGPVRVDPHDPTNRSFAYADGTPAFADKAERVAYNALPATWASPTGGDMWAHQYLQAVNEINAIKADPHGAPPRARPPQPPATTHNNQQAITMKPVTNRTLKPNRNLMKPTTKPTLSSTQLKIRLRLKEVTILMLLVKRLPRTPICAASEYLAGSEDARSIIAAAKPCCCH